MNTATGTVQPALQRWLEVAVSVGASDLHLLADHAPVLRQHGELTELDEPTPSAADLNDLLWSLCPADLRPRLESDRNMDFSFHLAPLGRFRANLFFASDQLAACMRVIPSVIPTYDWAGFPRPLANRLTALRDGLVIVTGATGSGKTTTLAMLIQTMNEMGGNRIITVEEPVEYLFPRAANSLVTQREVGRDVLTFADGLKYGLRQDPDVILVGEVRDRETAQMALSAAETGHLVLTTLHTRDAKGAITRFVDLFPPDSHRDVRSQLALGLRAVVSQRLLPGVVRGEQRSLALEVMWNNHPIASAIRQNKIESIDNYLQTGRDEGMMTFDESIRRLLIDGRITAEVAEQHVLDRAVLYR